MEGIFLEVYSTKNVVTARRGRDRGVAMPHGLKPPPYRRSSARIGIDAGLFVSPSHNGRTLLVPEVI
jgi:hypothetical protein